MFCSVICTQFFHIGFGLIPILEKLDEAGAWGNFDLHIPWVNNTLFHGRFSGVTPIHLITKIQTPNPGSKVKWSEDLDFFFIEDNFQNDPSVTGDKRSNFSASKKKHSFQKTQQKEYKTPVKKLFGLLYPRVNRWTHD